ncbi:hypothetical protein, partial [Streptomyces niveiscabiei]|uniref:hypothetical protein n=1 Tax=Streptomyces niveiscabiei TaxID=164115 RepID=UPI0038F60BC3
ICSSAVEDGDFARYEIDPLANHFLKLPPKEHGRSMREIYEEWRAQTIAPYPVRKRALARVIASGKEWQKIKASDTRSSTAAFIDRLE